MKFDHFTQKAKEALVNAQNIAKRREHQQMTPEHLLWALLDDVDGITVASLKRMGIDPLAVAGDLDRALKKLPRVRGQVEIYFAEDTLVALRRAEDTSRASGETEVAQDHILIGLFDGNSPASDSLRSIGVRRERLIEAIVALRGPSAARTSSSGPAPVASGPRPAVESQKPMPMLDRFSRDLTQLCKDGKIDPIIGRDDEMRRIVQILSRRTKNNPMLIGDSGVGKSAIIEGLAQRIATGDVPLPLKNKRLVSLDMGSLVAGAKLRGEFEERIKGVVKEIQDSGGDVLLYIDEIHTLAGAGKGDGAMDASSLLKPALARGELRCIGSTTVDEYRKYIEADAALARRFQTVRVEEPTVDQTIAILRGIKEKYEIYHGVRILDAALIAAAQLSARYVTDRNLPDKAIDLIDEAASRLRITVDSVPPEIDDMDRDVVQWEIEKKALEKETDPDSITRREDLSKKSDSTRAKADEARSKWHKEIEILRMMRDAKEDLERARNAQKESERSGDLTRAAEIKFGKIPALERTVQLAENAMKELQRTGNLSRADAVRAEDVALVVSQSTGIPTAKMLEGERQKLVHMEDRLVQRVVGQDHAVKAIADAVRLARAGLQDAGRPIGSFIFLGPTGVGKTELARALAEFMFDDEHAMIRLDMSEFMEKHAAARLVGSPPGYVGYDEGGQLTEAVRRRPYSVVLFDEVEKAHSDVFNLLLQLLDDGRLTDSKSRTVDFSNCVIIMTSNLGARNILELGPDQREEAEKLGREAMKQHFRPEFINRIDETIIFNALGLEQLALIADILLRKLRKRIGERKMTLTLSPEARELVIQTGNDPAFGARPLKRSVLSLIQKPLSLSLLKGDFQDGDEIIAEVAADKESLAFRKGGATAPPTTSTESAPSTPAR
jgi:ATP-dependent Clp protease ATP-binding subunit ClpB